MGLGVPKLRALFLEIFGHHTASNNGAWLRRKLCEPPDASRGRGRSASIRKRDQGAAIWTTGAVKNITQARAMHRALLGFAVRLSADQAAALWATSAAMNITQACPI